MRKSSNHRIKLIIFLFPIILSLILLSIKIWSPETYRLAVREDSVIEYIQVFSYFLSSIVSFLIFIRFLKHRLVLHSISYGILVIVLLFISLEEISWGQRIFHIEISDYFAQHNVQKEISFHNLDTAQPLLHIGYILIGYYGTFAWLFVSSRRLKCLHIVKFYVPDWFISSYFFFAFFIYMVFDYIGPFSVGVLGIDELRMGVFLLWEDQELAELLLSLGFLVFTVVNYIRLRKMGLTIASTQTL